MMNHARVTDEDILEAMYMPGDERAVAREVVLLFARRVGRVMSEAEIEDAIDRVLGVVNLPAHKLRS